MRNVDQHNITDAVNARLASCGDARLKQIMTSLTAHLHDFVRDVSLTESELLAGIAYLTATGAKSDDQRQEFILLSDVLGVSMLTVALNQDKAPGATEASVLGPFHVANAPMRGCGADLSDGAQGTRCFVSGQVRNVSGEPVPDVLLDIWHADEAGFYDVQYPGDEVLGRGRLRTDQAGRFHFQSIKPLAYPIPTDGPVGVLLEATRRHPWRPAHIHFMLHAQGYAPLVTQVFDSADQYLDSDAVFGVRSTLLGEFVPHHAGETQDGKVIDAPYYTLEFDFVLSPAEAL